MKIVLVCAQLLFWNVGYVTCCYINISHKVYENCHVHHSKRIKREVIAE